MSKAWTFAVVVAGIAAVGAAQAQNYPNKPIRLISPLATSGAADLGLRLLASRLSELGWPPAIVENRPGGGGAVAALAALQGAPDGYTLFQCDVGSMATNVWLSKSLPYDPVKDFAPVVKMFSFPSVLTVSAKLPVKSLAELIELGKTKPGGLAFASQGVGSGGHLLGTMIQGKIGKPMTHAPYKGAGPAMPDIAAGRVDMIFASYGGVRPFVEAGTARILAVTSKQRLPELPDVPTTAELGHGDITYDVWFGLCAPANTPADVVKTLNDKVLSVVNEQSFVTRLREFGVAADPAPTDAFRALIRADIDRLKDVVKAAGVEPQ